MVGAQKITAKLSKITSLIKRLRTDLSEKTLSSSERKATLEQLKVYGRDPNNADPIFAKAGIETLAGQAFDRDLSDASREALRCLANALFLREQTRQILVDLGYAGKAAQRLKIDNRDDEFLVSRILFLMTYNTDVDFNQLEREHQIAGSINQNIARHSKRYSKHYLRKSSPSPMDEMALVETLKLLFNITHYYPALADSFTESLPHVLKILSRITVPHPPLQSPVNYLINVLMNLDLGNQQTISNPIFPDFDSKHNVECLVNILDRATTEYKEAELDQTAAPLLTLIRRVYEIAPETVRKHTRPLLLPTENDRSKPLGKSGTLPSRLLRLSTSPLLPTLRDSISSLMFELSDKDPTKFVQNLGYGFAAGFLTSHNIRVPQTALGRSGTRRSKNGGSSENDVFNPITGQRLDTESIDAGPEMTEAEKEREAEKLFVLFERLKATGVIDVKNPVEQAIDDGRFEELD
ncbi:guanine nucleotide exchange factor [Cryomyces antarcticus]